MPGYGDNPGFTAYAVAAGYSIPDGATDDQITAARQRGALVIDRYEHRFPGARTGGYAQERAWPRSGAMTCSGEAIPDNIVPDPIINAAYEAAFIELTDPGRLSPVVTATSIIRREQVGSLSVDYAAPAAATREDMAAGVTPVATAIEGLLWSFLYQPLPAIAVV
jgi:hypothetical protein